MANNINVELDGDVSLQNELEELEERWGTDRVYVVGSNVEYAVYLEFGTRDMPPYQWFRPAVREFKANPESFITQNTGYPSIDAIPSGDKLVEAIAASLTSQMENNVSAASSADRSPGTHPEHPKRDTGNLVNSIKFQRLK